MTNFHGLVASLVITSITASTGALAQAPVRCDLAFTERSVTIPLLATELGTGQNVAGSETISISNVNDSGVSAACVADLRLSRITSDAEIENYVLTASNQPITPSISEAVGGPGSDIRLAVPARTRRTSVNFRAVASTDWGLVAGNKTERLQLSLIDQTGTVLDFVPFNLELDIPKTVDVMFVGDLGSGATSSINMGELSAIEAVTSAPFGVRIWSSSEYTFAFRSENMGELVHLAGMDRIPYELIVDGQTFDLGNGSASLRSNSVSAPSGDSYGLRIRVPARRNVAGEYQDRLTVTVNAI